MINITFLAKGRLKFVSKQMYKLTFVCHLFIVS